MTPTTRWPFADDAPHDEDDFTCHCKDCRDHRAARAAAASRAIRRDSARWMVDPDYLKGRKR